MEFAKIVQKKYGKKEKDNKIMVKIKRIKYLLSTIKKLNIKHKNNEKELTKINNEINDNINILNDKYNQKSNFRACEELLNSLPVWLFEVATVLELKQIVSLQKKKKHLFRKNYYIDKKISNKWNAIEKMEINITYRKKDN